MWKRSCGWPISDGGVLARSCGGPGDGGSDVERDVLAMVGRWLGNMVSLGSAALGDRRRLTRLWVMVVMAGGRVCPGSRHHCYCMNILYLLYRMWMSLNF